MHAYAETERRVIESRTIERTSGKKATAGGNSRFFVVNPCYRARARKKKKRLLTQRVARICYSFPSPPSSSPPRRYECGDARKLLRQYIPRDMLIMPLHRVGCTRCICAAGIYGVVYFASRDSSRSRQVGNSEDRLRPIPLRSVLEFASTMAMPFCHHFVP